MRVNAKPCLAVVIFLKGGTSYLLCKHRVDNLCLFDQKCRSTQPPAGWAAHHNSPHFGAFFTWGKSLGRLENRPNVFYLISPSNYRRAFPQRRKATGRWSGCIATRSQTIPGCLQKLGAGWWTWQWVWKESSVRLLYIFSSARRESL